MTDPRGIQIGHGRTPSNTESSVRSFRASPRSSVTDPRGFRSVTDAHRATRNLQYVLSVRGPRSSVTDPRGFRSVTDAHRATRNFSTSFRARSAFIRDGSTRDSDRSRMHTEQHGIFSTFFPCESAFIRDGSTRIQIGHGRTPSNTESSVRSFRVSPRSSVTDPIHDRPVTNLIGAIPWSSVTDLIRVDR